MKENRNDNDFGKSCIYDVRNFGAKGDGTTKDAAAIQQAIDACHLAGGGTVVLKGGQFISGGLYLKSSEYPVEDIHIVVRGCTMKNVSRPIWILLNNRFEPDGLGSSLELQGMPGIGTMENIIIPDIVMTDEEEMKKVRG